MKKKRLQILAAAMLFLLFFAYGCNPETKSNVNEQPQAAPQKPKIIPDSELKRMVLNIEDTNLTLRNKYNFYKETGNANPSPGYFSAFDDNKRPSDKRLTSSILALSSKEEISSYMARLEQDFIKNFPKNYKKVPAEKIGDSSFAYNAKFFGRDIVSVWFRKYNVVVVGELESGNAEEAAAYAKKIESKLDRWK